jgi:histidyl-tRNA synthetase
MELKPTRGTQDLLPPEGGRMRALYDEAAGLARLYGYRYVETPGFEATELFTLTSGVTSDVVSKETYSFKDRGGRDLTLRPEGTAPVMRAYLSRRQDLGSPFKAYYLTRMYRYARPQAGRFREHRQFGVEVFGSAEPEADVEVVALGDSYLKGLGLRDYRVEINSIGDQACRPAYREELVAYLRSAKDRIRDDHAQTFEDNPLRVLDCKDERCAELAAGAPRILDRLCADCAAHFEAVRAGLNGAGIDHVVMPTMVRGLDYYTRTAFEFVSLAMETAGVAQQSTLFGGGRYDGLAETMGGPATPGVGFGMGLERVLLAMEQEGVAPPEEQGLGVYVVALGAAARERAAALVRDLRAAGIPADSAFGDRPMKAQLKMADRSGAPLVAILGERELADGTVTIRRLADGDQRTVPQDQAPAVASGDWGSA